MWPGQNKQTNNKKKKKPAESTFSLLLVLVQHHGHGVVTFPAEQGQLHAVRTAIQILAEQKNLDFQAIVISSVKTPRTPSKGISSALAKVRLRLRSTSDFSRMIHPALVLDTRFPVLKRQLTLLGQPGWRTAR